MELSQGSAPGTRAHSAVADAYRVILAVLREKPVTITTGPDLEHLRMVGEALAWMAAREIRHDALAAAGGDQEKAAAAAIAMTEVRMLAWQLPELAGPVGAGPRPWPSQGELSRGRER